MLIPLVFAGMVMLVLHGIIQQVRAARRRPRANLPACMGFDLGPAARRWRASSGADAAEAARVERAFRRWFALVAASPVPLGMDSRPVDAFWHEVIGCTALYRRFCEAVAGRFIDHDPEGGSAAGSARSWAAWRAAYGEDPDPTLWPRPAEALIRAESVLATGDPAVTRAGAGTLRLHYPRLREARRRGAVELSMGCSGGSVVADCGGGSDGGGCSGDGGGCGGDGGGCGGGGGD